LYHASRRRQAVFGDFYKITLQMEKDGFPTFGNLDKLKEKNTAISPIKQ